MFRLGVALVCLFVYTRMQSKYSQTNITHIHTSACIHSIYTLKMHRRSNAQQQPDVRECDVCGPADVDFYLSSLIHSMQIYSCTVCNLHTQNKTTKKRNRYTIYVKEKILSDLKPLLPTGTWVASNIANVLHTCADTPECDRYVYAIHFYEANA